MINRVVLVGRLTKDPDLRYTPNGIPVSTFTLAVNRPFKNANGDYEADFINCVAWRGTAENLANYQKKGNLIGIDSRIQTRSYEANDGKRRYITEVVCESVQFLEPKKENSEQMTKQQQSPMTHKPDSFFDDSEPINTDDSDLPF